MKAAIFAVCITGSSALHLTTDAKSNHSMVQSEGYDNLCMMGRLAPKFFLLGTPKSGTTYFFEDFSRSDQIKNYKPGNGEPSWHSKEPWAFWGGFDDDNKLPWLKHYPECQKDKPMVAVDCTPGYFGDEAAPFAISRIYGWQKTQLVFMVFLREPVERAHSHFYQYLENGVLDGAFEDCPADNFPKLFSGAVEKRLTSGSICNCACDDIFEDSMYADAFRRYFKNFGSSRFHVVPFQFAITAEIVTFTWDVLKVSKGYGKKDDLAGGGNAKNHHDYPSLDQEMPDALKKRFMSFMNMMSGQATVAHVLAGTDAKLYRYQGSMDSEKSIAEWLSVHW